MRTMSLLLSTAVFAACLLRTVHGQSERTLAACRNSTLLIDSLATLSQAQQCDRTIGDLVIEDGSELPSVIEFPRLREVGGGFLSINIPDNIHARRLSAPNLTTITGDLYLSRWANLTTIDMPLLKSANRIRLDHLPALTSANLLSSLESIENNYEVWNTSLAEITNDKLPFAVFVEIYDNPRLEKVELSALKNASFDVALRRNRPGLEVSLPELEEVWHFEVQGAVSISIPKLQRAIGHFIVNTSSLERLEAPVLKSVGIWNDPAIVITDNEGLIVENCPRLTGMSFPILEAVQLDLIVENTALRTADFPALKRVTGNVAIQGSLENVSMPQLERVGGVFYLGSDSSGFDCGPFDQVKRSGGIRGDYSCPTFREPGARSDTRDASQAEIDSWLKWLQSSSASVYGVPSATMLVSFAVVALLHVIQL
ncbi:hypothetical protein TWF696_001741 [Orbilia brochopaga]|uniref:Receptor L-domain domain-containing protein n=1 Tax=Orbilia brochopaga TaxID=3140254 RepID=A0AAV9U9R5_9PEZI